MNHLQKQRTITKILINRRFIIYIYHNELDKACFQHDTAYEEFKNLTRRTDYNKIFCDKACVIAKNAKYVGYQRGLASMVYKVFDSRRRN